MAFPTETPPRFTTIRLRVVKRVILGLIMTLLVYGLIWFSLPHEVIEHAPADPTPFQAASNDVSRHRCDEGVCVLSNICVDKSGHWLYVNGTPPLERLLLTPLGPMPGVGVGESTVKWQVERRDLMKGATRHWIEEKAVLHMLWAVGNFGHTLLQNVYPILWAAQRMELDPSAPFSSMQLLSVTTNGCGDPILGNVCKPNPVPLNQSCRDFGSYGYRDCSWMRDQVFNLLLGRQSVLLASLLPSSGKTVTCFRELLVGLPSAADFLESDSLDRKSRNSVYLAARDTAYKRLGLSPVLRNDCVRITVYEKPPGSLMGRRVRNWSLVDQILDAKGWKHRGSRICKRSVTFGGDGHVLANLGDERKWALEEQLRLVHETDIWISDGGSSMYYSLLMRNGTASISAPLCGVGCACNEQLARRCIMTCDYVMHQVVGGAHNCSTDAFSLSKGKMREALELALDHVVRAVPETKHPLRTSVICRGGMCEFKGICADEQRRWHYFGDGADKVPVNLRLSSERQNLFRIWKIHPESGVSISETVKWDPKPSVLTMMHSVGNFGHSLLQNAYPALGALHDFGAQLSDDMQVVLTNECVDPVRKVPCDPQKDSNCQDYGSYGYTNCPWMKDQLFRILFGGSVELLNAVVPNGYICFDQLFIGIEGRFEYLLNRREHDTRALIYEMARNRIYTRLELPLQDPDPKSIHVLIYDKPVVSLYGRRIMNLELLDAIFEEMGFEFEEFPVVTSRVTFSSNISMTEQFRTMSRADIYISDGGSAHFYSVLLREGCASLSALLCLPIVLNPSVGCHCDSQAPVATHPAKGIFHGVFSSDGPKLNPDCINGVFLAPNNTRRLLRQAFDFVASGKRGRNPSS